MTGIARCVSRRSDVAGAARPGGKLTWLTFMPVPMTHWCMFLPEREFSISVPHIFISSAYMSFGHLTDTSGRYAMSVSLRARALAWLNMNPWLAGMSSGCIFKLKRRFCPWSLIHAPLCPRPLVWYCVVTTIILSVCPTDLI